MEAIERLLDAALTAYQHERESNKRLSETLKAAMNEIKVLEKELARFKDYPVA